MAISQVQVIANMFVVRVAFTKVPMILLLLVPIRQL